MGEANTVKNNQNWRREFMMQQMRDQLKIEEGRELGRELGIEEGRELGIEEGLINLVMKKMRKAKDLDTISEELECKREDIEEMYGIIQEYGVESSTEEILEILHERNNYMRKE
ncbi:MAG: hypothetical protein R3Y58_11810 [Eubacteriales bacterium]